MPKGRKVDLVVEKATELGVHAIVPFTSAFSIGTARGGRRPNATAGSGSRSPPPSSRAGRRSRRSCRHGTFHEILADAATHEAKLLFFEGSGTTPFGDAAAAREAAASAAIVVGPEGGFSLDEVAAAEAAGFALVGLGPRVLRTETAALVAITLVQAAWGDLAKR